MLNSKNGTLIYAVYADKKADLKFQQVKIDLSYLL